MHLAYCVFGLFRKKPSWKLYLSFFSLFFAIYAFSFATEDRHEIHSKHIAGPPPSDAKALQDLIQKYEELLWLGTKKSPSDMSPIPSEAIFTKPSPGFDRAVFGLKTLSLFLEGKYEDFLEFISGQPKDKKLEWNEFQEIQTFAKTNVLSIRKLSNEKVREVLEFALILDEVKNSQHLESKAWIYEISEDPNHSLLAKVLKTHPDVFPTYSKLSKEQQTLLLDLFLLPSLNPILTLSSPSSIFERFQKEGYPKKDPHLLEFFLFYSECLLAKREGDTTHYYSNTFNTYAHKNFALIRKALFQLEDHTFDFATQYYIRRRGDFLDLDASSPLHRVLIQIAAERDLYTPAEGKTLKDNLLKLPMEELSNMINGFSKEKKASHQ